MVDYFSEPPGAPQNLKAFNLTDTTVVLTWNSPQDLGGRTDTFYNVYTSTLQTPTLLKKNAAPVYGNTFLATSLTSDAFHQINVVAENGVSSQAGNEYLRSAITFVTTSVGGQPLQLDF